MQTSGCLNRKVSVSLHQKERQLSSAATSFGVNLHIMFLQYTELRVYTL